MVINNFPQLKTEGELPINARRGWYSYGLACCIQFRPDFGPCKFYFNTRTPELRSTSRYPALKTPRHEHDHACTALLVEPGSFWDNFSFFIKAVKERQSRRSRLAASCLLRLGFFFLAGICSFKPGWLRLNAHCLPDTLALRIMSDVTVLMGLIVALWARIILGGNWSASVTFKQNHELIERRPCRFVRHPIYTGVLLMILGTAIIGGRAGPFLALMICFLAYRQKPRQEEALLTKHFPETCPAYKSRTKALIPFLFWRVFFIRESRKFSPIWFLRHP
jgi:protein-S-isoprenylcysteine O-methyltransferase Ste14